MISTWAEFEKELTERTVDSINSLRELQSLTVKELAARLRGVGWPVSDSTLAGILSGRKRGSMTVGETFAFARALNVSPVFLVLGLPHASLMPDYPALWGSSGYSTVSAAGWIRGYAHPPAIGDGMAAAPAHHGLDIVMHYSNARQAVRWQAALFTESGSYSSSDLEAMNVSRDILRTRLELVANRLIEDHSALEGYGLWEVPLPALPPPLADVAVDGVHDAIAAMTDDDIRALARKVDLERARDFLARNLREAKAGGYLGATTDSAE